MATLFTSVYLRLEVYRLIEILNACYMSEHGARLCFHSRLHVFKDINHLEIKQIIMSFMWF